MVPVIHRDPLAAARTRFDLIVVGGGIYGAALALCSVLRGFKPLLVERGDFGQGTSLNSLRIVHGGLRYLQSLDLRRFRASVAERSWFLRQFPELVRPLPCLMPLYNRGLRRGSVLRAALALNDMLSQDRNTGLRADRMIPRGRLLSREETIERCPAIDARGLRGGALWFDAVMPESQRLVMEILRWAVAGGAIALNYVEATGLISDARGVQGVRVDDRISKTPLEIRSPVVVNCAGPDCRRLAARFDRDVPRLFRPSLAVNLLVDRAPPAEAAVAVAAPDGGEGTYFIQGWNGKTLVGTHHVPVTDNRIPQEPPESIVMMMLHRVNQAVPALALDRSAVLRVLWGLLPARDEGGARLATHPAVLDHGKHGGPAGLFSISGVKFTTARRVAERGLMTIGAHLGDGGTAASRVPRPPLAPVPTPLEVRELLRADPQQIVRLAADLARTESALTPDDVLLRRTAWGFDPRLASELLPLVESGLSRG